MTTEHLLRVIEIPTFLDRIVLSKKRRKKYYYQGETIPRKYLEKTQYLFDDKGILIHKFTGEPVIKNIRTAGTEKTVKISGQDFWTGINCHLRSKISKELKKFFYESMRNMPVLQKEDYPIGISLDIYDTISHADLDNLTYVYRKTLHDALCGNVEFDKNESGKYVPNRELYPAFIEDDELLEVTPTNLRVRKRLLSPVDRQRAARDARNRS